jgi:arylsulfatase A-like enzyme
MRTPILTTVSIIILTVACHTNAVVLTGETLQKTDFTNDVDGDGTWDLGGGWRDNRGDSDGDDIVYDAKTSGEAPTWSMAKGFGKDLRTDPAINTAPGYDPSNTTRLMGFDTANMDFTFKHTALSKLGADAEFGLKLQIDVKTTGGNYRLQSQVYDPASLASGSIVAPTDWSWSGGSYLGDLTANGGVALDDITSIDYSFAMQEIVPNTSGTGTVFFRTLNPTLIYQVEVNSSNAPRATNDVYGVNEDSILNVAAPGVLANDTDPDSLPLTAHLVAQASNGTVVVNSNGSFSYTPAPDFFGTDTFTYAASNGTYATPATVTVMVTNTLDAPIAIADSYVAHNPGALNVTAPGILENDIDIDQTGLTASLVSGPDHGALILNPDGSFVYTPTNGYLGADSFDYQVVGGNTATVSLTVRERGPNFVIIFADDMGYGDMGCNGFTDIHTPAMDAMASNGVRFTQGYVSASVCGPSRCGLLTGVYQARYGAAENQSLKDYPTTNKSLYSGLPITQPTIAELLEPEGYKSGVFGKWHLGATEGLNRPLSRGFDRFFGFLNGAHDYYVSTPDYDDSRNDWPYFEDNTIVNLQDYGYATEAITDHAVDFINAHTNEPFFLYVAYNAVHSPWQVPQIYIDRVNAAGTTIPSTYVDRQLFAGMVLAMDDGVGAVTAALEANGLSSNTLVFFISDNGTPSGQGTGNSTDPNDYMSNSGGFRGFKGTPYEGGIRVPFIASWPGTLPSGVVYSNPVSSLDVSPTFTALAGAGGPESFTPVVPPEYAAGAPVFPTFEYDGVNLMPYLTGQNAGRPHNTLYFRRDDDYAIRIGDYKFLLENTEAVERVFDLATDPYETNDLASTNPELLDWLKGEFIKLDRTMPPSSWWPKPTNRTGLESPAFDSWMGAITNETYPGLVDEYGDLDGNGVINYAEYAFILNPNDPASKKAIVDISGALQFEANVRHDDATLAYLVQISGDLESWETITLTYSGGSWSSSDPTKIQQVSYSDNGNGTGRLTLQTGAAYSAEQKLFVRIGVSM